MFGVFTKIKIKGEERGGEKEVAHKLRFDGEAVGMWKTEGLIGAALAHESEVARYLNDI